MPSELTIDYGTSTGGLFEWALTTMKANMVVRRKGWDFAIRLDEYERDIVDAKTGEILELTTQDLLARDWDTV